MPQILMSNAKGVVQSSGAGLVLEAADQLDITGADAVALSITHPYHRLSAEQAVTLNVPDGVQEGQMLLLSHLGVNAAGQAKAGAITLGGAGNLPLGSGESVMLVWTGDAWQATSQTLS